MLHPRRHSFFTFFFILFPLWSWFAIALPPAYAQDGLTREEELARLLQNPLASIAAIMTDNSINFGQGQDQTGYDFQIQPVYAIPTNLGFNFIPRAIIPIVGAPPQSDFARLGDQRPAGGSTRWGLSDITTQFFFSPSEVGGLKWGVGPQVSLRTRTDSRVAGAGWGGGPVAIIVGDSGPWGFAGFLGNLWGQDDFNLLIAQPMVYYNIDAIPGAYAGYNNVITINWDASPGDQWWVPLGLTVGRALDMGSGHGLDLSLGAYGLAVRPDGAPDWQLKIGMTWILPR